MSSVVDHYVCVMIASSIYPLVVMDIWEWMINL